jgi:hypothetical protein
MKNSSNRERRKNKTENQKEKNIGRQQKAT